MTLNDLKTGMIVTWRNGEKATVLRDTVDFTSMFPARNFLVTCSGDSWVKLDHYNNDFTNRFIHTRDIVKVEVPNHPCECFDYERNYFNSKVIWEEPAVKMTVAEIETKLGYKIEIVSEDE